MLGWYTRQVAIEASRSSTAAETRRREDLTRERAMQLLQRVVEADAALRNLIRDLGRETTVNASLRPGTMDLPPFAWPAFAARWSALAPELTTYLYVADFVEGQARETVRARMEWLESLHDRGDDRASLTSGARSLMDALERVRAMIDRALGLSATHRRL